MEANDDDIGGQEEEEPILFRLEFTAHIGSLRLDREGIAEALFHEDTRKTAVTIITLLDFFLDHKSFFETMQKNDNDFANTMDRVSRNLALFDGVHETVQ